MHDHEIIKEAVSLWLLNNNKAINNPIYEDLISDTILEENTISTFVDYLQSNNKIGMVGPKIVNSDGTLQKGCKRSFPTISVALPKILGLDNMFPNSKWAGKYNLNYLDADEIHTVDAISGSCMFIRSDLFKKIKYMIMVLKHN